MKAQHGMFITGLPALISAVVLLSSAVFATSSTSSLGCVSSSTGDGFCDQANNNEDCAAECHDRSEGLYGTRISLSREAEIGCSTGFDGGDCCPCNCVSVSNDFCAFLQSQCVDPDASCLGDDTDFTYVPTDDDFTRESYTSLGCIPEFIGDGDCDRTNNNEDCGFDAGDCCQCTCVNTPAYSCGENGDFECVDPSASCVDDDDVVTLPSDDGFTDGTSTSTIEYDDDDDFTDDDETSLDCIPSYIADGDCDRTNDNEDCGYDGGDCCQCTCVSTEYYTCGENGFQCVDPSAPCVDDDDGTERSISDDPSPISDDSLYTSLGCIPGYIADGDCDTANDNEGCEYDGGDCCQCTCVSTEVHTCGDNGFQCVDPSAPCVDDDDVTVVRTDFYSEDSTTSSACTAFNIGDNFCDAENNSAECDFDGGDCCPCTCDDLPAYICAYYQDILCIDPSSSCEDEEHLPQCFGNLMGDGKCDQDNNNENCDFDGGDCCECSCASTSVNTCGDNDGFQCVDPSAYCLDGFVEAGTKTIIGVTANAYDERLGEQGNDVGCGEEGCTPLLVRDGAFTNTESRWSCAGKMFPDGGVCEIGFTFETPQDIVDLQVAFWKRAERERTLQVTVNGDAIGEFSSDPESAFTSFVIDANMVQTLTLQSVGVGPAEWISLLEVRFIVEP